MRSLFPPLRQLLEHPIICRFIPRETRDQGAWEKLTARVMVASTLMLLFWGPFFSLMYLGFGAYYISAVVIVASVFAAGALPILRVTGSYRLAGNIISGTLCLLIGFIVLRTGGLRSPAVVWMLAVPLFVRVFGATRSVGGWYLITLVFYLGCFAAAAAGIDVPQDVPAEYIDVLWVLSLVGISIVIMSMFVLNTYLQQWLTDETREHELEKRRAVERELVQRKELEAKMMRMDRMIAVGTLASGVAHEINNPLAFVNANVDFLLQVYRSDSDGAACQSVDGRSREEVVEALQDIKEGSQRIQGIVSELRSFAAGDKKVKELAPIDLHETLESALKMAKIVIGVRARLVTDYGDISPVWGVESNLAQVFLNLCTNAAQAIEEGGVDDNEIRVRTRPEGEKVVVEFSDTGSGIPEEIQPYIFDSFFSTKERDDKAGMGLGLGICRNLLQECNGEISYVTEPGRGTTFRVELDACNEAEQSNSEVTN